MTGGTLHLGGDVGVARGREKAERRGRWRDDVDLSCSWSSPTSTVADGAEREGLHPP